MKTIVLIHGWGFTPRVWNPLRAELGHFRLLTAEIADCGATLEARADTLAAMIDTDAIMVGWSLGAMLAIEIALRHPEKTRGLGLISATQRFVADADWQHGLRAEVISGFRRDFLKNPERTIKRFMALQTLGDTQRLPLQKLLEPALAKADSAGLAEGLAILEKADLRNASLPESLPVLLIHGAHDALMPIGAARALANNRHSALLHEIPDAGHCPLFTDTARLAALIRNFALEC